MKRVAALLLTLALLIPACALAKKATPAPEPTKIYDAASEQWIFPPTPEPMVTFGFTAEEWLEQYRAQAQSGDILLFDVFDKKEYIDPGPFPTRYLHRHYFDADKSVSFSCYTQTPEGKSYAASVGVSTRDLPHGYPDDAAVIDAYNPKCTILRPYAEKMARFLNPTLTVEDIADIFKDLGLDSFAPKCLTEDITITRGELIFALGESGGYLYFRVMPKPV